MSPIPMSMQAIQRFPDDIVSLFTFALLRQGLGSVATVQSVER